MHEAFFDPVAIGAGVGADGSRGVLHAQRRSPSAATAATLQRLIWEANQLQLELSAAVPLAAHYLDRHRRSTARSALRLGLDDATTASHCGQAGRRGAGRPAPRPGQAGDQLMLRLRHSATALLRRHAAAPGCGPAPTYGDGVPYDVQRGRRPRRWAPLVGTITATAAGGTGR